MLCRVYYIIEPQLLKSAAVPVTENTFLLPIQISPDALADCFRIATALNPAIRFCLALPDSETMNVQRATNLIAFFFFPNYFFQNGMPEVVWQYGDLKKLEAEAILLSAAKAQGFSSITMQQLQPGDEYYISSLDSTNIGILKNVYRSLLHDSHLMKSLFIEIHEMTGISSIEQALLEEDQAFRQQHPDLFYLKEKNKELNIRLQQAEQIANAAAQEIQNYKSHVETLRSQSQATYLQQYYNNEYEVLPLWYKRFGHLIKVATGKRTVRSLFNSNEKKYRS